MNRRLAWTGWARLLLAATSACSDGAAAADPPVPVGMVISPVDSLVRAGATVPLTATYLDESGNPLPGGNFTWTTSDATVAVVSGTGVVTTKQPGPVTIGAAGSGFAASLWLNVVDSLIVTRLDVQASPFGIAIAGTQAFVTLPLGDSLRVINTTLQSVVSTLPTGGAPTEVAVNPAGTRVYVANQDASLGVIDPATNTTVSTVSVPGGLYAVVVSGDGATVWTSSTNWSRVYSVDAAMLAVTDTGPAPVAAQGLARHPTLPRLYSGGQGEFIGDPNVYELDAGTLDSLRSWVIDGIASEIAVAPDGSRLFVADQSGMLNVIALPSGVAEPKIPLLGGALGMTLSPDGTRLALSVAGGWVEVYSLATLQRVKLVFVGGTPRGLAYTTDGSRLLVTNENRWVDFIR